MPTAAWAKLPTRLLVLAAAGLPTRGGARGVRHDPAPGPGVGPDLDGPVQTRQVTVVGEGKVEGTPDTVTVNAVDRVRRIRRHRGDEPDQRTHGRGDRRSRCPSQGIDRKDVSTQAGVNRAAAVRRGDNSKVITGYQASNSIEVKIRKTKAASPTINAIQNHGRQRHPHQLGQLLDRRRLAAGEGRQGTRVQRCQATAPSQYADLSGLRLGKVISISEARGTSTPTPPPTPMPRFDAMAAAPVPLQPGQQTVGFSVTVVWELG